MQKQELQIDEDIHQQQQVWLIERISWGVMALVMVAAIVGLLGHGPLSSQSAGSADAGFVIHYQRFERHEAKSEFRLQITPEAVQNSTTRLRINQQFLDDIDIDDIRPRPERLELDGDFIVYTFNTPSAGEVVFHLLPTGFGRVTLQLGLEQRPLQSFPLFIYP